MRKSLRAMAWWIFRRPFRSAGSRELDFARKVDHEIPAYRMPFRSDALARRRGNARLALVSGGARGACSARFFPGCARHSAGEAPAGRAACGGGRGGDAPRGLPPPAPAPPPPSQGAQQPAPAAQPAPAPSQQQTPAPAAASTSQQQAPPADNTHAIKAETNEVRVDVVVTDKKGNYITDLTQKDFKVYEDNKEQPVNTFSFGGDPAAPAKNQRHYLVLFFDTTSMDLSDQPRARDAAAKFIAAHAGPDQVMSVMNFGGSLQIVQNFTTDADRLRQAVSVISNANITSVENSSAAADLQQYPGMANFGKAEAQFGTYSLLISMT